MPVAQRIVERLTEQPAPARRRRLYAKTEKTQPAFSENRPRHPEGEADQNRSGDVGQQVDQHRAVRRQSGHLTAQNIGKRPLFEHAFKALLLQLLVIVSRSYSESLKNEEYTQIFMKHRRAIEETLSYTRAHYAEDLRIETVAKLALMSQSYFCYFFKLLVGKTFTQYLIEVRIEHAKEALAQTELSVTDVAINSGFNNVSHFIRTFKANVNLSPIQYRKISKGSA